MAASECIEIDMGVPNEKQEAFFLSRERFVAYGGARGGGKSWALRKKALLMALYYPGIRILIIRRSYPELRENHIIEMCRLIAPLGDYALYRDTDKAISFVNGSRIKFGYLENEADSDRYQGQEYDVICLDEATQFTEGQFRRITACLRGANGLPKRFFLTCNPGGAGHDWVKRLFVDRRFLPGENPSDYAFIRAGVYDNAALMENDPGYVGMLESLPDELRRVWLDGDWSVVAGRFFEEFAVRTHVVSVYEPPLGSRIYRAIDYGLDMLACLWIAVEPDGSAVAFRELYKSGLVISQAAEQIAAESRERSDATLAPPDMWNRRQETGRSVADLFLLAGIPLTKAPNSRVSGWIAVKEWLRERQTEVNSRPMMRISACCQNLIRVLPLLTRDQANPNDVSNQPHELTHLPDALRMFCAYMPPYAENSSDIQISEDIKRFLSY